MGVGVEARVRVWVRVALGSGLIHRPLLDVLGARSILAAGAEASAGVGWAGAGLTAGFALTAGEEEVAEAVALALAVEVAAAAAAAAVVVEEGGVGLGVAVAAAALVAESRASSVLIRFGGDDSFFGDARLADGWAGVGCGL